VHVHYANAYPYGLDPLPYQHFAIAHHPQWMPALMGGGLAGLVPGVARRDCPRLVDTPAGRLMRQAVTESLGPPGDVGTGGLGPIEVTAPPMGTGGPSPRSVPSVKDPGQ